MKNLRIYKRKAINLLGIIPCWHVRRNCLRKFIWDGVTIYEMPSNYFVSGYDLTLRAINLVNDTTPFYKVIFSKYIRQLMITPEIHRIHILYNSRIAFWNPWDCLRLNDESSVDVINAAHIVLLAADSYLMEAKRGILGEHHHSALACKAALRFVEKLRQQERYRTDTVKILTKVLRFWDIPHED